MKNDAPVLQGSAEAFDEEVVHPLPPAIRSDADLGLALVKAGDVDWLA